MKNSPHISRTVWIVDDDPIARLLIKKTVERSDLFDLSQEFTDGVDIIEALESIGNKETKEPDLILLDINMPDKDGWEVLDFIREQNISLRKAKLVLLTSSINPKDKAKAFGFDSVNGFLNKPLAKEDLESLNL
ncbi:MAG TPA: response regulator [Cryomorphaceae bacterium]|nr:response regulator [Cryomorphaceae bacterium]